MAAHKDVRNRKEKRCTEAAKKKIKKVWVVKDDGTKELVNANRLYRYTGDMGWRLKVAPNNQT